MMLRALKSPTALEITRRAGACALAVAIFALERHSNAVGAISPLYVIPLILGAYGRGTISIAVFTAACCALAIASLLTASGSYLDHAGALSTTTALIAIGVASWLLWRMRQSELCRDRIRNELGEMRHLADLAPIFLWRADKNGRVTFFNHRFTELTGRDVDEMVENQSWLDILHPEDQITYLRMREDAKIDESERQIRVRVRNPAGGYLWALVTRRPTRDLNDEITGWIGGASNIDAEIRARNEIQHLNDTLEQRVSDRTSELAQSEARLRSLLDSLNIAYVELDISEAKRLLDEAKAAGASEYKSLAERDPHLIERCMSSIRLVHLNDALVLMLGYEDFNDWTASQPAASIEDARQVLSLKLEAIFKEQRQFTGSTVLIAKDGKRIPVAFSANVPSDWSTSMCTLIDISEKQKAHDALLLAREELARANRAATIGALSTSLAHELNQPILAIVLDTQTCMRWLDMDEPQIPQARKALERLSKNAARVSGIVRRTRENLVKRDRKLTPVNVADLVRETHMLLERDLAVRRTLLRLSDEIGSPLVMADPVELQQVFINLISNASDAMQFSKTERRIEVTLHNRADGNLNVRVEDNGPGLPAERINDVFDPFFTTKPGGMGMGLQICRTIVESFGGKLWANNRTNGGAYFEFTLPSIERPQEHSTDDGADYVQQG